MAATRIRETERRNTQAATARLVQHAMRWFHAHLGGPATEA